MARFLVLYYSSYWTNIEYTMAVARGEKGAREAGPERHHSSVSRAGARQEVAQQSDYKLQTRRRGSRPWKNFGDYDAVIIGHGTRFRQHRPPV